MESGRAVRFAGAGTRVPLVAQAVPSPCVGRLRDMQPPKKRLKLTGGDRSKGNGVLCAGAHELSFNDIARGGRVACSLSAIR
jgi:hypothetical protein